MTRRRQLWFLIFLTAGAAVPQYVMQSALIAPDGVDGLPAWFWLIDKLMWALRALIEPWVIVYLFTTHTRTWPQKAMQAVLLIIELGLLVLIVVTVGPSIAAVRLGESPPSFLGLPWDWMLAAYTSLMMAGAGFAYRVQPHDKTDDNADSRVAGLERALAVAVLVPLMLSALPGAAWAQATPVRMATVLVEHWAKVLGDLTVGGGLEVADDATVGGDAAVTGGLSAATLTTSGGITGGGGAVLTGALITGDTTITATNGLTITPAYTAYNLDSAGAVTVTLAACTAAQEGQVVLLGGDDANNVTVADLNIRTTDGNALVIGQYDLAGLMCVDAEWLQIFKSANQ